MMRLWFYVCTNFFDLNYLKIHLLKFVQVLNKHPVYMVIHKESEIRRLEIRTRQMVAIEANMSDSFRYTGY